MGSDAGLTEETPQWGLALQADVRALIVSVNELTVAIKHFAGTAMEIIARHEKLQEQVDELALRVKKLERWRADASSTTATHKAPGE